MELFREGGVREGNRGGLGLFKWSDVQKDVGKECYLGNTVKASQGRWQNHKNIHWFVTKKEEVDTKVDIDEIAEIKRKEAEAMAEAMGLSIQPVEEAIDEKQKEKLVTNTNESIVGLGLVG
jgi:predicted RNA-binding protein with PUA-like domain